MNEYKKIVRGFILTVIWTLFVTVTLCGIITAGERTRFVSTGEESVTVKFSIKEKLPSVFLPTADILSFINNLKHG